MTLWIEREWIHGKSISQKNPIVDEALAANGKTFGVAQKVPSRKGASDGDHIISYLR